MSDKPQVVDLIENLMSSGYDPRMCMKLLSDKLQAMNFPCSHAAGGKSMISLWTFSSLSGFTRSEAIIGGHCSICQQRFIPEDAWRLNHELNGGSLSTLPPMITLAEVIRRDTYKVPATHAIEAVKALTEHLTLAERQEVIRQLNMRDALVEIFPHVA